MSQYPIGTLCDYHCTYLHLLSSAKIILSSFAGRRCPTTSDYQWRVKSRRRRVLFRARRAPRIPTVGGPGKRREEAAAQWQGLHGSCMHVSRRSLHPFIIYMLILHLYLQRHSLWELSFFFPLLCSHQAIAFSRRWSLGCASNITFPPSLTVCGCGCKHYQTWKSCKSYVFTVHLMRKTKKLYYVLRWRYFWVVREARADSGGEHARRRNKKERDFTHFLTHKSTLLSRYMCSLSLYVDGFDRWLAIFPGHILPGHILSMLTDDLQDFLVTYS